MKFILSIALFLLVAFTTATLIDIALNWRSWEENIIIKLVLYTLLIFGTAAATDHVSYSAHPDANEEKLQKLKEQRTSNYMYIGLAAVIAGFFIHSYMKYP